jgi:uncharacterized protein YheU (UPF0270 family)
MSSYPPNSFNFTSGHAIKVEFKLLLGWSGHWFIYIDATEHNIKNISILEKNLEGYGMKIKGVCKTKDVKYVFDYEIVKYTDIAESTGTYAIIGDMAPVEEFTSDSKNDERRKELDDWFWKRYGIPKYPSWVLGNDKEFPKRGLFEKGSILTELIEKVEIKKKLESLSSFKERMKKLEDEKMKKLEDEKMKKLEDEKMKKLEDEKMKKLEDENEGMEIVDVNTLVNGDCKVGYDYFVKLMGEFLLKHQSPVKNKVYLYYYQYEFDSSQTTYEMLMDCQIITIKASSYGLAMLLNVALRCIISGVHFSLNNFIESMIDGQEGDDYSEKEKNFKLTKEALYNEIVGSDAMNMYDEYVVKTPKEIDMRYKISIDGEFFSPPKKPVIFTKRTIALLLLEKLPTKEMNRVKRIIEIAQKNN